MSLLRQNTDYALRVMVHLAHDQTNGCISARTLAQEQEISYQFACKILQQLHEAKLVDSTMGPKGGYRISRPAEKITMNQVIEAVQGPIDLNRCMKGLMTCPRQSRCPVAEKLSTLQSHIGNYLEGITLAELSQNGHPTTDLETKHTCNSLDPSNTAGDKHV
jgi:Rrf2 family protein